jgi:hypothetical protein
MVSYLLNAIKKLVHQNRRKPFNGRRESTVRKESNVLWTISVILLILWLLGLVSGYTIRGFIHILLVIAIVAVLIRIIEGRRPF